MKKNLKLVAFSAILLMLAGSFFSCGDKEKSFLTVDETPIIIETAEAGTYSIAINSNGEWTAVVENADWCTLNNSTGNGNDVITINVAENTLYTPRSATVKITAGSLTKSVVVNQGCTCIEELGWSVRLKLKPQPDESYLTTEDPEIIALVAKYDLIFEQTCPGAKNPELLLYYDLTGMWCNQEKKKTGIKAFLAIGLFEDEVYEYGYAYLDD